MTLKTVNVHVELKAPDGAPISGALVTATLDQHEVSAASGQILPTLVSRRTDENGWAILPLWPNTLGTKNSKYTVEANVPSGALPPTEVTVPHEDNDSNELFDVYFRDLSLVPGAPLTQLETAQQNLVVAQSTISADRIATEAAKDKAELWAEEVEDTEVETGKFSAKHYSLKAEASKQAASQTQSEISTIQSEIDGVQDNINNQQSDITQKQSDVVAKANTVNTQHTTVNDKADQVTQDKAHIDQAKNDILQDNLRVENAIKADNDETISEVQSISDQVTSDRNQIESDKQQISEDKQSVETITDDMRSSLVSMSSDMAEMQLLIIQNHP